MEYSENPNPIPLLRLRRIADVRIGTAYDYIGLLSSIDSEVGKSKPFAQTCFRQLYLQTGRHHFTSIAETTASPLVGVNSRSRMPSWTDTSNCF